MAQNITPEFVFEASWEVCNLVGGIYTVLSTRAASLQSVLDDKLLFVGPDIWKHTPSPYFSDISKKYDKWIKFTKANYNLDIKVGRWTIPGQPLAVLVDFTPLFTRKNTIYTHVWELFGVDSLAAYGDYDESSMFGYASGMVIESFYKFNNFSEKQKVVAHFNEWMTSFGVFYLNDYLPTVATLFTTHATSIGRSIAGNNKPLYDYLSGYNGTQMSRELNMVSKHSCERTAAHLVDCFTTVSDITARECSQLLEKNPDIVTPNGFEDDFVPKGTQFTSLRKKARNKLKLVAETLIGYELPDNTLFVSTAGRYEFKNKGIDTFIESLKLLSELSENQRSLVAFIMVPAHIKGPRLDLLEALTKAQKLNSVDKVSTHELYDDFGDNVISSLRGFNLRNDYHQKVKVIFVPSYLDLSDGIFNTKYYDLLIGMDLTVFPSYYEPWGYTPLESVAFSVPTITTDLSGFGQWVSKTPQPISHGVGIIHRSDKNAHEVAVQIAEMIKEFEHLTDDQIKVVRKKARSISKKALWSKFIKYYWDAYHIALKK